MEEPPRLPKPKMDTLDHINMALLIQHLTSYGNDEMRGIPEKPLLYTFIFPS